MENWVRDWVRDGQRVVIGALEKEEVRAALTNGWKRAAAAGFYLVDWLSLYLFFWLSILKNDHSISIPMRSQASADKDLE